jgi:short subunit dehydrogenase-like uncharacterized protein
MITLFGATGYTGRLVAQALSRELPDVPLRLAGRSPEKLARLSAALPGAPAWLVADATRPGTLPVLFQDTALLVNCAGPFTDLGEPVVAQAALNGVHYLDTTNELGYVYRLRSYDALAQRSGAAIVPACGFEVALADCAAAELRTRLDRSSGVQSSLSHPLDEIAIVYDIRGRGSSFGSRRSAVRALATSWLGYRDGQWVPSVPCRERRRVELPGGRRVASPGHLRPALSFPSSEIATVPGHVPVRQVTTWLATSWHAPLWAPVLVPIFAWLARGMLGRLAEAGISQIFAPPETGLRSDAPFAILVEVRQGEKVQTMTLTGKGVYDLTAEIVAYAAGQLAQPGRQGGVLAPAQALDPRALLEQAAGGWGVQVRREA